MGRERGERAGLSRDEVVAAALAIVRDRGLDALSMRQVAAALGVAPNALYSHVPDKAGLVDAVLDAVLVDVAIPRRGDWRTRIEALLLDSRRVLLAHPDLVPLFLSRQTNGPNALRLGEALLEQCHRGGMAGEQATRALQVLLVHTIGSTAFEVPRLRDPAPEERHRRSVQATQRLDPDRFPHMTASGAALASHPAEDLLRLGIRWLLDGLAADAARQRGGDERTS
jgi:AcrR family transcriptional regulator